MPYVIIIPVKEIGSHKVLKFKNLDFAGVTMHVIGLLLLFFFGLTKNGVNRNSPNIYVTVPIGVVLIIMMMLSETVYLRTYENKYQNKVALSNSKFGE